MTVRFFRWALILYSRSKSINSAATMHLSKHMIFLLLFRTFHLLTVLHLLLFLSVVESSIPVLESSLFLSVLYKNSPETSNRSISISTGVKDTSMIITDTNNTNTVVVNCNAFAPVARLIDQLLASFQNVMGPTKTKRVKETNASHRSFYCISLELPSVILRYNIHTVNFYMYLNNVLASFARSLEQVALQIKLKNRIR